MPIIPSVTSNIIIKSTTPKNTGIIDPKVSNREITNLLNGLANIIFSLFWFKNIASTNGELKAIEIVKKM